jgi:hypothetical protein
LNLSIGEKDGGVVMVQEYLFASDDEREQFSKYSPVNVNKMINDFEDSDCWIAVFTVSGNTESGAIILSEINEFICKNFHCVTLTNESSSYFNRALFPHINEFERKLRKLLYIASEKSGKKDGAENISELEIMDLGVIFDLVFTDANFIKQAKTVVNNKSWQFTKNEILNDINAIIENPLGDRILGCNMIPSLRSGFGTLKSYRNDVMHAHNINSENYKKAKLLFKQVIVELDEAIDNFISTKSNSDMELQKDELNASLKNAINTAKTTALISGLDTLREAIQAAEVYKDNGIRNFVQQFSEAAKMALAFPDANQLRLLSEAAKIAVAFPDDNQLRQLSEAAKIAVAVPNADQLRQLIEAAKMAVAFPDADQLMKYSEMEKATMAVPARDHLLQMSKSINEKSGE